MLRRALALVVAAAGGIGLLAAYAVVRNASLRQAVIFLLAGGVLLCGVAAWRRHLELRPSVRWLALAVTLVFAGGAAAIRQRLLTDALPHVPDADPQLRALLGECIGGLPWLCGALVHFGLAVVLLPGRRRNGAAAADPNSASPQPGSGACETHNESCSG